MAPGDVGSGISAIIYDQYLVSVITRSSAERLGLQVGDRAYAVITSTEVMIGKEDRES